jgi:hypothetical protein
MDINADVDEGLDPTFDPANFDKLTNDSLVKSPTNADATVHNVTFITPVGKTKDLGTPSATDLFGKDLKMGELPRLDASFKLVEKQSVNIVGLKEVEDTIFSNGAISQEDAKMVGQYFDDFLPARSLNEFTKLRSQTEFKPSLDFMKKRIALEEIKLKTETMNCLSLPFAALDPADTSDHVGELVTKLDEYAAKAGSDISSLLMHYRTTFDKIGETKNCVFPTQDGFINILTEPLSSISGIALTDSGDSFQLILPSLKAIEELCRCPFTVHYLRYAKTLTNKVQFMTENSLLLIAEGKTITLGELLALYSDGGLRDGMLNNFSDIMANALEYLDKARQDIEKLEAGTNDVHDYVVKAIPDLSNYVKNLHYVQVVTANVSLLTYAMQDIMQFLSGRV